ncbi:hypothetical protein HIM_01309 [Hirsutella minnesotensis 3608]|nr:hypothetical protein HIM_01309 [Hirsutella minnesotensis 3608]
MAPDVSFRVDEDDGSQTVTPGSVRHQNGSNGHSVATITDLHLRTAREIHGLIFKGRVTVEEYARALIRRFDQRNHEVKAWSHYDKDNILSEARRLDGIPHSERGPLHGVAVGVKDIFLTKDMPTRYNSAIHENDGNAATDSDAVAVLKTAGALILGKTATTEFAAKVEGSPCCNPRALKHTPGGSSSGSAAAVSDNQVPLSIGSQTGGSIIRPASFNGLYALKPTWGLISTDGMSRFSTSCDTVGLFAKTLDDLILLSNVYRLGIDHTPPPEPFTIRGSEIAFIKSPVWDEAGPGTRKVWENARSMLVEAGATILDVDLPEAFYKCHDWREVMVAGEARSTFLSRYMRCPEKLHPSLRRLVENEHSPSRQDMLDAYNNIAKLKVQWDEIAKGFDLVITPSAVDEAPYGLHNTGNAAFNIMWTALHAPTLNVPGFHGSLGLPVGLTLVGPRYGDMNLLRAAGPIGTLFQSQDVSSGRDPGSY